MQADGSIYEGDWANDQEHGHGTETRTSQSASSNIRSKYSGMWSSSKRHGRGELLCFGEGDALAWSYSGNFADGWPHSKCQGSCHDAGLYVSKRGSYQGQVRAGLIDGHGRLTQAANGVLWEGIFSQGHPATFCGSISTTGISIYGTRSCSTGAPVLQLGAANTCGVDAIAQWCDADWSAAAEPTGTVAFAVEWSSGDDPNCDFGLGHFEGDVDWATKAVMSDDHAVLKGSSEGQLYSGRVVWPDGWTAEGRWQLRKPVDGVSKTLNIVSGHVLSEDGVDQEIAGGLSSGVGGSVEKHTSIDLSVTRMPAQWYTRPTISLTPAIPLCPLLLWMTDVWGSLRMPAAWEFGTDTGMFSPCSWGDSMELEEAFASSTPSAGTVAIGEGSRRRTIDFDNMLQRNDSTGRVRLVRRRQAAAACPTMQWRGGRLEDPPKSVASGLPTRIPIWSWDARTLGHHDDNADWRDYGAENCRVIEAALTTFAGEAEIAVTDDTGNSREVVIDLHFFRQSPKANRAAQRRVRRSHLPAAAGRAEAD